MFKYLIFFLLPICFTSCTYSINMAHTEGTTSDLIDDTATPTVETTANVPINPKI